MTYDASYDQPKRDLFDPMANPALFDGIRSKRVFAFLIDVLLVAFFTFVAGILVFFLGIFTLGLAWFFYAFLWQAVALIYTAVTLGGPNAATPGMRAMGIEMRLWYGAKPYALLAAMHVLLFWLSFTLLTPLVVLISLFSDRKRLLHDIVLGTVVMNSSALNRV
ncbi:RDD family protein [Pannonibacter carbonis]|uniref:RDD family protein n=1 Tax=Pannonibacter carbonis TaxID=2067569 RepID=UPI000D0E9465|nr:RDD family protein [Pannonibacter carbonis]